MGVASLRRHLYAQTRAACTTFMRDRHSFSNRISEDDGLVPGVLLHFCWTIRRTRSTS